MHAVRRDDQVCRVGRAISQRYAPSTRVIGDDIGGIANLDGLSELILSSGEVKQRLLQINAMGIVLPAPPCELLVSAPGEGRDLLKRGTFPHLERLSDVDIVAVVVEAPCREDFRGIVSDDN